MNYDFILEGNVYFPLKGRAKNATAIVSENKWPFVSKYEWYLGKAGYPLCYKLGKMPLHRFIFVHVLGQEIPKEYFIDHIDRNKLNNTNENLRLATPQENSFNRTTKSNLKGVKKISETNYTATVTKDGKKHEIKNIGSADEAAHIYNMMAQQLFGEFAALNTTINT